VQISYNLHWRADGAPSIVYNGTFPLWNQWQALGFDAHSLNTDPMFVAPQNNNFTLAPGSPARNAGLSVTGTPQIAINIGKQ
jgi:hypothetical protein